MRIIIFLLLIAGCSDKASFKNKEAKNEFLPQESPIKLVGFTRSLIEPQKRFMGYGRNAGRVSVIDPAQERETEAFQIDVDYDEATPLDSFEGLALFSQNELMVISKGVRRSFSLSPWSHWGKAVSAAALGFSHENGCQFKLVRNRGSGLWQERDFVTPWPCSPENHKQLVTLISDDGRKIVALTPETGSYAVYAAQDSAGDVSGPVLTCDGGTIDNAIWSAAYFDGETDTLILGNANGVLARISVNSTLSCQSQSSWSIYPPQVPKKVLSIGKTASNELAATFANGDLLLFSHAPNLSPIQSFSDICENPVYPVGMAGGRIALICLSGMKRGTEIYQDSYFSASLSIYDREKSAMTLSWPVTPDNIAGAAIDQAALKIYILRDSSIGVLDVIDAKTGEARTRKGIFLYNILK
ncbi:MAG: hypothetical protein HQK54_05300 [Oligoflexales bacterium]|nr:hypothetical protein [Oligoflexales bacterium]